MKKLNLGCGRDTKKSYVNIDRMKVDGVDVIHDLNKFPYPFKDNTFDEIYCKHILEHLDDFTLVMDELYRISKNNAIIHIRVPFYNSYHAFRDPTHKTFFSYDTFYHFEARKRMDYTDKRFNLYVQINY